MCLWARSWELMDVGMGALPFFCRSYAADGCLLALGMSTGERAGSVSRFCPVAGGWELIASTTPIQDWRWSWTYHLAIYTGPLRTVCSRATVHWPVGSTAPTIHTVDIRYPLCGGKLTGCHWQQHSFCGRTRGAGAAVGVSSGHAHSSFWCDHPGVR